MDKCRLSWALYAHSAWLRNKNNGEQFNLKRLVDANLTGADLTDANLDGADLYGANIDYATWPLWCGSLNVKVDERIAKQLVYRALSVALPHMPVSAVTDDLLAWANEFHRNDTVLLLERE